MSTMCADLMLPSRQKLNRDKADTAITIESSQNEVAPCRLPAMPDQHFPRPRWVVRDWQINKEATVRSDALGSQLPREKRNVLLVQ